MQTMTAKQSVFQVSEWIPVFLGLMALYLPTYYELANTLWASDAQGQGPIILGVVLWLFWQKRLTIHEMEANPQPILGWGLLIIGLLFYTLGRAQGILLFEVGSHVPVIAGLLMLMRGVKALKVAWFPVFFLIFMVPLPSTVVDALTLPMKTVVSWSVDQVLYWVGYPISRSGVILQIGQYKLLVADACAGLHTLFTLEALGLFYLHAVKRKYWLHNALLAVTVVPISMTANSIRVLVLALITYHFGDDAGQGFLHGFAGMVLFISALLLIISFDSFFYMIFKRKHEEVARDNE
ncbi:MAG: exosortase B [Pseudomonadales bacterium]|nr:exosortase B [Pseudomonadales bacterium]